VDDKLFFVDVPATEAKSQKKNREKRLVTPLITSLPSLDPHVSRKQREPDREEQDRRQFRHRCAWDCSIESRSGCHAALAPTIVSPVVDARVDYRRVSRAPPVAGCAHLIELVVPELPLVTPISDYGSYSDSSTKELPFYGERAGGGDDTVRNPMLSIFLNELHLNATKTCLARLQKRVSLEQLQLQNLRTSDRIRYDTLNIDPRFILSHHRCRRSGHRMHWHGSALDRRLLS